MTSIDRHGADIRADRVDMLADQHQHFNSRLPLRGFLFSLVVS
jgi:hypothetical protein